jgi:hypothetical protein
LILTAMLTGGVFYFLPGQLSERTVASIHRIAAWGVLGYVVLHVAAQLALGGVRQLLKILSPRVAYGGAAALAAGASLAAVGGVVYVLNDAMIRLLPVQHAADAPTIDGLPDEPVWAKAMPVEIPTVRGAKSSRRRGQVGSVPSRMASVPILLFECLIPPAARSISG